MRPGDPFVVGVSPANSTRTQRLVRDTKCRVKGGAGTIWSHKNKPPKKWAKMKFCAKNNKNGRQRTHGLQAQTPTSTLKMKMMT